MSSRKDVTPFQLGLSDAGCDLFSGNRHRSMRHIGITKYAFIIDEQILILHFWSDFCFKYSTLPRKFITTSKTVLKIRDTDFNPKVNT